MPSVRKMFESALSDAAQLYATKLLWRVFPLRPNGKEPMGNLAPHGVYSASNDASVVQRWWLEEPQANIGLACGHSFFVLDVDPRNHGDVTLATLVAKHGALPETVVASTGGGGMHYFFACDEGAKLRSTVGEGLDVKSYGGYVVAAPSIHPNTGRAYVWDGWSDPASQAIAPTPTWLVNLLADGMNAKEVQLATGPAAASFMAKCFDVAGWLGGPIDSNRVMVRCPWLESHSADTQGHHRGDGNDSSTAILSPTPNRPLGTFSCQHSHCVGRGNYDALISLPRKAVSIMAHTMPTHFWEAVAFVRGSDKLAS